MFHLPASTVTIVVVLGAAAVDQAVREFGGSEGRTFAGSPVRWLETLARAHQEPPNRELTNPRTDEPTNREASFWCPMHPNVRSADAAATCAECGMALVAIPDRRATSYWLDVRTQPTAAPAGRPLRVELVVRDRTTNDTVTAFDVVHERPLHLFVVSSDLRYFEHVHPTARSDGAFEVTLTLPLAGVYRLAADLLPRGAPPQMLQHTLVTSGYLLPIQRLRPEPVSEVLESIAGGVRARLAPENARTGDDTHLVLALSDQHTGAAIADVEQYLGAWGHMFLASYDLADVVHSHPLLEATKPAGPTITFQTLLARSGWYRAWAQVQRRGRLLTFGFTLRVAPPL